MFQLLVFCVIVSLLFHSFFFSGMLSLHSETWLVCVSVSFITIHNFIELFTDPPLLLQTSVLICSGCKKEGDLGPTSNIAGYHCLVEDGPSSQSQGT